MSVCSFYLFRQILIADNRRDFYSRGGAGFDTTKVRHITRVHDNHISFFEPFAVHLKLAGNDNCNFRGDFVQMRRFRIANFVILDREFKVLRTQNIRVKIPYNSTTGEVLEFKNSHFIILEFLQKALN